MEVLAIIYHETHQLIIDVVSDEELEKFGGEEEAYIDATHGKGFRSWDYIVGGIDYRENGKKVKE